MVTVISLGGSIIAPDKVDTEFLSRFRGVIEAYLAEDEERKIIFITGGGGPARAYQQAYREVNTEHNADSQDWIGIAATRLNGALLKGIFSRYCPDDVVTDPTADFTFTDRILVAAGWKPGFSTDYDAVILAERFGADTVINLSNIAKVYSDDPRTNPDAVPLDEISWNEFRKIVGDEWSPGKNAPFDPVASKRASELGLTVIAAAGRDMENLEKLLRNGEFEGTVIRG